MRTYSREVKEKMLEGDWEWCEIRDLSSFLPVSKWTIRDWYWRFRWLGGRDMLRWGGMSGVGAYLHRDDLHDLRAWWQGDQANRRAGNPARAWQPTRELGRMNVLASGPGCAWAILRPGQCRGSGLWRGEKEAISTAFVWWREAVMLEEVVYERDVEGLGGEEAVSRAAPQALYKYVRNRIVSGEIAPVRMYRDGAQVYTTVASLVDHAKRRIEEADRMVELGRARGAVAAPGESGERHGMRPEVDVYIMPVADRGYAIRLPETRKLKYIPNSRCEYEADRDYKHLAHARVVASRAWNIRGR